MSCIQTAFHCPSAKIIVNQLPVNADSFGSLTHLIKRKVSQDTEEFVRFLNWAK